MPHVLEGFDEKLNRARENIVNLTAEIDQFLSEGGDAVLVDDQSQATQEAVEAHRRRTVPPRFSVLAGECIHNLRSALDHLAWQLVIANRNTPGKKTCFPIYSLDPARDKNSTATYDRCVHGMSATAKTEILGLQPYQPANRTGVGTTGAMLGVLHDLNIIDKHHEIMIVNTTVAKHRHISFQAPSDMGAVVIVGDHSDPSGAITVSVGGTEVPMQMDSKITLHVAFAEFGLMPRTPVQDGLWYLFRATHHALAEHFVTEFK